MAEAWAPARVALAGNPSDGYGGAVLALTVDALRAQATTSTGPAPAAERVAPRLLDAARARFARLHAPAAAATEVGCVTSIPRCVGLGGSSAIVIATLRALCIEHGVTLSPLALAELALAVEVEDLGIAAGPQDRIAQAFGGLTFMDFAAGVHGALDPAHLPPLLLAWSPDAATPSGGVHDDLRARYARGDPVIRRSMERLRDAAHAARAAAVAGDHGALARAADASFDARSAMLKLDPRQARLVALARDAGAAANYAGSGGAVVCVCVDGDVRLAAERALGGAGCRVLAL